MNSKSCSDKFDSAVYCFQSRRTKLLRTAFHEIKYYYVLRVVLLLIAFFRENMRKLRLRHLFQKPPDKIAGDCREKSAELINEMCDESDGTSVLCISVASVCAHALRGARQPNHGAASVYS